MAFNNSIFSRVFNKNDHFVERWCDNVYNKIKNSKILPEYISRERKNYSSPLTYSDTVGLTENSDFTLGNALVLSGENSLALEKEVSLPKNFEITFELYGVSEEVDFELTSLLTIKGDSDDDSDDDDSDGNVVFNLLGNECVEDDLPDYTEIKITREHFNWRMLINGEIKLSFTHNSNNPINISGEFIKVDHTPDLLISNFKILTHNNNKVLHWWRFNTHEENKFIDVGVNDYDFYSFFYSIIKIFAYIVRFSKYFRMDTIGGDFIKRFLDSRGVYYYINSSYDELLALFQNWNSVLRERGTLNIANPKDEIKNYSLVGGEGIELKAEIIGQQNLGSDYSISFELEFGEFGQDDDDDDDLSLTILDCITISKDNGNVSIDVNIVDGGNSLSFSVSKEVTGDRVKVKLIKISTHISFYINDEWVDINETLTAIPPDLKVKEIFDGFTEGLHINFLRVVYWDNSDEKEVKYLFNDVDSLFINSVDRNPAFEARLFGESGFSFKKYFAEGQFEDIDNFNYKEIRGELLRIFNKGSDTELVLVGAGNRNLSWVMGVSSPLQSQTYPIEGFNKLPNKKQEVIILGDYPLRGLSSGEVGFDEIYFDQGGVKVTELSDTHNELIRASNNYLKQWKVPCMSENSYEVSFRMAVNINDSDDDDDDSDGDPDFNLTFGMVGSGLENVKTNAPSTTFINNLTINKSGYYWVRGIIYGKDVDLTNREKGLSVDVVNTNHLQFSDSAADDVTLSMRLSLKRNSAESPVINFSDFQFRLLSLPLTKTVIGVKNLLFLYGRNNTDDQMSEIEEKVRNLIPFSYNLKIIDNE